MYKFFKRFFDIILSGIVIIVLSPLLQAKGSIVNLEVLDYRN